MEIKEKIVIIVIMFLIVLSHFHFQYVGKNFLLASNIFSKILDIDTWSYMLIAVSSPKYFVFVGE